MHEKCLGNLIIKIIHHHFHCFHVDNLADGNSPGTSKFPKEIINAMHTPHWDATCQGVSMEQTLEVEEVPTMGTHDHTTIPTLTPHHKEFIFADASGIVHTDTEPLQNNPHYNQDFDTSELFFSDPYNNEENYHAHTQQNEDNLITPDQHNDYDTIGYDDGYGYPNEQHPDQHS